MSHQATPGMMQISWSSYILDKSRYYITGHLNAKHPFRNSAVSNPSGAKLLDLLHINEFEISQLQCPTHYSPAGYGDGLDIVMHKKVRLSRVIISDILHSDHISVVFH
jgi:hypothetical protein